jgi:hypothetical protein
MTKIHLLAAGQARFLNYAVICAASLMRNGGVLREDILLTTHVHHASDQAFDVLVNRMKLPTTVWGHQEMAMRKFILVGEAFQKYPAMTTLLQLDSDTALTEPCDFMGTVRALIGSNQIASYQYNVNVLELLTRRSSMFDQGFKDWRIKEQRGRLSAMMKALLGITLEEFKSWLAEPERQWVYGGFIIFTRSLIESPMWPALVALAYITACDETVILMARCAAEKCGSSGVFDWGAIEQAAFPHRVSPKVFSLDEGLGMVHFAGDWYRMAEDNKALIDKTYLNLTLQ